MKKIILLLVAVLFSLSCSKDVKEYDVREDLSYLNFQNEKLRGIWYFSKVIKADGSLENYIHFCQSNKDYVDFQPTRISDYYHSNASDCTFLYEGFACGNFFTNGYTLTNCNSVVEGNYTYSNATNTLRVDYSTVLSFSNPDNNMVNIKGLIFTRN